MRDQLIKLIQDTLNTKLSSECIDLVDEYLKGEATATNTAWDIIDELGLPRRGNRGTLVNAISNFGSENNIKYKY